MTGGYVQRDYRRRFREDRRVHFTVKCRETDLCIGIDRASWQEEIPAFARRFVKALRAEMDAWIARHPEYARALVPQEATEDAPGIFHEMAAAARRSGIGPMSAVAGAVARRTGEALKECFGVREVMVENGGDIYADLREDADIAVFAGASPLSERVGLRIRAEEGPVGICTSSGTVGPSLSLGKADAVMVVCRDAALADTYATAFANEIQSADDIPACLERMKQKEDILAAIAIKEDKIGISGIFELILFEKA